MTRTIQDWRRGVSERLSFALCCHLAPGAKDLDVI
jgi:hypothetical protein